MGIRPRKGMFYYYCDWCDSLQRIATLTEVEQMWLILKRAKIPWACATPHRDKYMIVLWNYEDMLAKIEFDTLESADIAFRAIGMEMKPPAKGDYGINALFFKENDWGW